MRRIRTLGEARSLGPVDIRGDPWFRAEEVLFVPASLEPADWTNAGALLVLFILSAQRGEGSASEGWFNGKSLPSARLGEVAGQGLVQSAREGGSNLLQASQTEDARDGDGIGSI
jgi:hypothetical protein